MTRIVKITLLFFIVFAMTSSTCYKNKPFDEESFVYSNVEDIIYPPDEFQLFFNLRTFNNYEGIIVFKNNSVWEVEKVTAFSTKFWIEREYPLYIATLDFGQLGVNKYLIGFAADTTYHFWANNNSFIEPRNLFVRFRRLDNNYETFDPKF
ncbi:MAG: hypothetical protein CVU00_14055 [Bacteroidetes bacterium HGW-Bacteroidetes-17]|jgi:hypothetical protein|nr:MAG: hypothetical protein CVU00_14055 [Bacteroidetes bacterium HGW-Bacteroidetes-17]